MPLVLGVTLVTSEKKKSYRTKIYENHDRIEKYRKTKTLINNTLKHDFKNGIRLIICDDYLLVKIPISNM